MSAVSSLQTEPAVFLAAYLEPLKTWLDQDAVTEVLINRPGEVWIEASGQRGMQRASVPALTELHLNRLAEQIARTSNQGINRERPLIAATLPDGSRVQIVGATATRGHMAIAIRRHRLVDLPLEAYDHGALVGRDALSHLDPIAEPIAYLRRAVAQRKTILISGGTSTGKTTFLNSLLREVTAGERVILVEDTPEIRLPGPNGLGLVGLKGETGEALVSTDDLLQAALRLRPDRIVLGELRGREAVSFLRAINTGHPGSLSTIHANSPRGALEQLSLMVMQAGLGLTRSDTISYAKSVIDIIVQLDRIDGERRISAITPTRNIEDF